MAIITPGTPFGADMVQNPAEKALASVNGKPITNADVDNCCYGQKRPSIQQSSGTYGCPRATHRPKTFPA